MLKDVFIGVVSGLITAAATITAASFGYLNKDRELDIEMVRVSLSILAGERSEGSLPGRLFALRALEQYSGVEIPSSELEKWAASGTIPQSFGNQICGNLALQVAEQTKPGGSISSQLDIQALMQKIGCFRDANE